MSWIKPLVFACLILPAIGIVLFGPRSGQNQPKDRVIVEYWEKWTGEEGEGIQATVNDFNNTVGKEKGIYVNLLSTSGIVQKTLVATAGGVPPDVAGLWEAGLAQLASLGALDSLDDLAAAHNITAATYKKVFWDECHYNGKLYALISTPYCYALHYNTKLFSDNADKLRAAGLDPTRPPRTIDELDAYAKALDDIDADGIIHRTGYLPLEPGWDLTFMPYNFGGSWWDDEHKKFTFLDPKVVQCFTWVQSYSKRLGKAAVANFRSGMGNYDSPLNPFMASKTAMVSQGTFFANVIHTQRPSLDGNWAAAPLPVASPQYAGTTSCTADVLCIPAGAKHKKEAFEFIAWLQEQPNMEKLCKSHTKISPLSKVSKEFLENNSNPYIKVFNDLADGPNAHGTPRIEVWPDVDAELSNFKSDLAAMRVTPEEGLKIVQERAQAKYDAFVAKQALRKD
jgi:multiple sugar transport system substrate-binding protein